jgi:hypothetical protein
MLDWRCGRDHLIVTCLRWRLDVIVVYWLEHGSDASSAQARSFAPSELSQALKFAEDLRARRKQGEPLTHVAIQSEMSESVGGAGVSDPASDYAHYKRRIDPAIPLGRPSGTVGDG